VKVVIRVVKRFKVSRKFHETLQEMLQRPSPLPLPPRQVVALSSWLSQVVNPEAGCQPLRPLRCPTLAGYIYFHYFDLY
jgi:hypothetical protein